MKGFLFCLFFSICIGTTFSQKVNSFWIGFSPTIQTAKETRFTSNFRSGLGYVGTLGFSHRNDKRTIFLEAEFSSATLGRKNISTTRNLQPNLQFTYVLLGDRKINFGPDIQVGSLLQFRNGVRSSNNSISYIIWNSAGLFVNKPITIGSIPISVTASLPLISYVIRPSYSFPFTDRFLLPENYNLALDDLGTNIVQGGKLRTLNSFINLKLGVEAYRFLSPKFGTSVKYQFNYLTYLKQKSLFQFTHQLIFTFTLNNKK